jgi:hypothetical protein
LISVGLSPRQKFPKWRNFSRTARHNHKQTREQMQHYKSSY